MGRVFAAADIGSNTVHLLVAETTRRGLRRLHNVSDWMSLGQVVSHERMIPEPLVDRLLLTLTQFQEASLTFKAEGLTVFATEAMRSATNHPAVLDRIRSEVGIEVDLISPRREAELSYQGIQLDCAGPEPFMLLELGGGSAQVAWCHQGQVQWDVSLAIGTGRLLDLANITYPVPEVAHQRLAQILQTTLGSLEIHEPVPRVVACGGVARGLWRALHPDGDRVLLRQELEYLRWASSRLTLDQISQRFGVKAKRSATLFPGSMAYLFLMEKLGVSVMEISEYGVREGAIREMALGIRPAVSR
ncbi:MAG TPA: hypothetical protein PLO61_09060 [Fimbriimonadaceae bacterium]|nr:hypothetical protein [Fimbriimonadaceae bacterium]HRJ33655.1 hypothetical protein [Fimbriimonadaceae bacterium]